MTNIKRRDFVRLAAFMPLLSSGLLANGKAVAGDTEVANELKQVVDIWFSEMDQTPANYLESRGLVVSNAAQIKLKSIENFKVGEVISINGLVLSQTEGAILAEFALENLV